MQRNNSVRLTSYKSNKCCSCHTRQVKSHKTNPLWAPMLATFITSMGVATPRLEGEGGMCPFIRQSLSPDLTTQHHHITPPHRATLGTLPTPAKVLAPPTRPEPADSDKAPPVVSKPTPLQNSISKPVLVSVALDAATPEWSIGSSNISSTIIRCSSNISPQYHV